MKEKLLMTLEKKGHKKLWDIVNTLRERRSMTPQRKNYMISMKQNYQQKNGLSILQLFLEKAYQKHTNSLTEQWDPLKRELFSNEYIRNAAIVEYRNSTIQIPYRLPT